MKRDIRMEAFYPFPAERVWRALTDTRALSKWLMPNDFEPSVGHRFQFRTKPAPGFDGIVHCEVIEIDEPRLLAFSWRGGPIDTVVRFRLEPTSNGTRVRFEQSGFDGVKAMLVSFMLGSGWKKMFAKALPQVIENIDSLDSIAIDPRSCQTETA